jgi:hypothetical protein
MPPAAAGAAQLLEALAVTLHAPLAEEERGFFDDDRPDLLHEVRARLALTDLRDLVEHLLDLGARVGS